MGQETLTHSDRYVRKTNRIILIVGIITLCVFLFGLMLLGASEEETEQHYEIEKSIDAETDLNLSTETDNEAEIEFNDIDDSERPITMQPNPVDMGKIVLGKEASNVLTIGTNGKKAIRIISVELEDAPFEGFKYESNCKGAELRGKLTCMVTMKWMPTVAANVQNNFKIIWHETNVSESNSKHDEVPVFGSAVTKDECNYCEGGVGAGDSALSETAQNGGKNIRYAIGPDGKPIGIIGEDGIVRDFNGNEIGYVKNGMIYDKDGNIIGVASTGKMILDENGNVIGYVDENGVAHDLDGNVIGQMLADGTIVDANGKVIGRAVDYGYVYDKDGNIVGQLLSDGTAVDANNNVIGHIDEDGKIVDMDGNELGKVAKAGEVVFDESGQVLGVVMPDSSVVDADGNAVGFIDADGNLATEQIIGKRGATARLAVDANGNVIGYIDENGNVIDFNGNIIGHVDENGNVVDANGNIIGKVSDEWRDLAFDENGNVIGYIDENGVVYGQDGKVIGRVDKDGNVRSFGLKIIGGLLDREVLPITPAGKVLGEINNRGEVVNEKKVVGKLRLNGLVTDLSGTKVLARAIVPGSIVNWGCDYKYRLDKDGVVRQNEDSTDHRVYADGTVWSTDGRFIGKVVETGNVYDNQCNYLGKVTSDGYVRDSKNKEIGCVNPDGTVLDLREPKIKGHLVKPAVVISNTDFRSIGNTDSSGVLRDESGKAIACMNHFGDMYDQDNVYIGKAVRVKYAYSFNGKPLGVFGANGQINITGVNGAHLILKNLIADSSQRIIGYALPEINILYDSENNKIGHLFPDGNVYNAEGILIDNFNGSQEGLYAGKAARFVYPQQVVDMDGVNIGELSYDLNVYGGKGGISVSQANTKGQIFDDAGHLIGGVVEQGGVRSYTGLYLGSVTSSGEVIQMEEVDDIDGKRYSPGEITGNITPDGHVMRNKQVIGEVLPNNIMVDVFGNFVGVSNDHGQILDTTGHALTDLFPGGGNNYNYVARQSGVVINFAGSVIGIALPDGSFMDNKHVINGKVLADGKVMSGDGKFIGEVVRGDIVIGNDDKLKGTVGFDGKVYNNGIVIGHILTDGLAVDNQNNIIGHTYTIGNAILSNKGEYIGRLSGNGRVIGHDNTEIGYLKSNGSFVDLDKNVSGYSLPEVAQNRRN